MTSDALDWISKISSILGLWSFLVIITFLILCWRKMSYVGYVVLFPQLLTRPSARYTASATLAKKPEGKFKASKMRYNY